MSLDLYNADTDSYTSDTDYEKDRRGSLIPAKCKSGKRWSLKPSSRRSLPFLEAKRGSIFQLQLPQLDVKRGSIFQLFDDPYRGGEPMRRLTLADELRKESLGSAKKKVKFQELTIQETDLLRKQFLYEGEYRVLNISVLIILGLIVFAIIFMSVWHYNNQNFWALYLVLGLISGAIGINLMAVKLYFKFNRYARYEGNRARSDKGVTDLIFVNLGIEDGSGGGLGTGDVVVKVLPTEKSDV